mgnify:FL=1
MNKEKNIVKKGKSLNLRFVLCTVFILMGYLPVLIYGLAYNASYRSMSIENRKIELKSNNQILSNRISSNLYLSQYDNTAAIDSSIEALADAYNARILVVDKNFKIVKDSFNIAMGKYSVANDTIKAYKGETTNVYDIEKEYISQAFPIHSNADEKNIDGVLLVRASTKDITQLVDANSNRLLVFNLIILLSIIIISIYLSGFIERPFISLLNSLNKISNGNIDTKIEANSYTVTRDISQNINSTLEKLKAVDKSREDFVANVSHELKTPITSIRVLADSIMSMEDVPTELYKEFMNDISDEIDRESKIIDDLLSLVKMDKAETVLNTEEVDINLLIKQILKRLRPIAAAKKVEIIYETIREVVAEVDETKLSLAITNLVENAIKYNTEGGSVKVSLDADHKFFYIKVSDTGIGIPEAEYESIFERFYRVDKARSRSTGGTGLGLSITKNIILKHKGIIKLSSKEEEGSTFTVRIPLNYIVENRSEK